MTFRDISFWGLFKISLVIDFLIPILLAPLILLVYLTAPEKFNLSLDHVINIYGFKLQANGEMSLVIGTLIACIIGLWFQTVFLNWLGKYTRLGRVKIG